MRLTSQRLTADNIASCGDLWGDRAFYSQAALDATLRRAGTLLREERARGVVIVDQDRRPRYFGLTVFVNERAADELVAHSSPRIGSRLLRNSDDDILGEAEIGRGNAQDGLHLVVINQGYDMAAAGPDDWGVLMGTLLNDFHEVHRGFRLTRMLGEVFGEAGVHILTTSGVYPEVRLSALSDLVGTPVPSAMFWMTHAQAIERWSALLPMFTYFPPRVWFTGAERAVLREALRGATDGELQDRLGLSLAAIKSRWTRAYERIVDHAPHLLPPRTADDASRGNQIRHIVLEYVRGNPSELTPFDRTSAPAKGRRP